jgi:hypothetical protein
MGAIEMVWWKNAGKGEARLDVSALGPFPFIPRSLMGDLVRRLERDRSWCASHLAGSPLRLGPVASVSRGRESRERSLPMLLSRCKSQSELSYLSLELRSALGPE